MELSARKRAVLSAIIRTYIETGEPVGSKILVGMIENSPSSATLRNEMSELCELGLLAQPHTSAGRIPTSHGFRLYVNSLMQPVTLNDSTKKFIDSFLSSGGTQLEELPQLAAKAISELTGLPAVSCFSVNDDVTIRQVGITHLSARSALLYLITSDGRVKSRICKIPYNFDALKDCFERIVRECIKRTALQEMNMAKLQNIIAGLGFDAFDLMPIITDIFEMSLEASKSSVCLKGVTGLYRICGEDNARRILELVERSEPMIKILDLCHNDGVVFGNDTNIREFYGTALMAKDYKIGNRVCGKIGVIGHGRMSYEQIIPSIEYTAERLSDIMTAAGKDMED